MDESTKRKIADACLLLLAHGFTLTGPAGNTRGPAAGKASPAPKASTTPAPAAGKTADGRALYTCGKCGEHGHNARSCPKGANKGAQSTPPAAAAKAAAAVPTGIALDLGDLDLSDLGGAPAPKANPRPAAAKPAASKPTPKAEPEPEPEPEPDPAEALDDQIADFLGDLDNLLPGD